MLTKDEENRIARDRLELEMCDLLDEDMPEYWVADVIADNMAEYLADPMDFAARHYAEQANHTWRAYRDTPPEPRWDTLAERDM